MQTQLPYPRYERLRGLASFKHQEGYYKAAWERIPYAHLFERVPMLEMALVTIALAIVFGGLALVGLSRDPNTEAGAWYATGMIVVRVPGLFCNLLEHLFPRAGFFCQSIRFFR